MIQISLDKFLSHLCGEEDAIAKNAKSRVFLSHLCGEEVAVMICEVKAHFLSHLCGEEGYRRG